MGRELTENGEAHKREACVLLLLAGLVESIV